MRRRPTDTSAPPSVPLEAAPAGRLEASFAKHATLLALLAVTFGFALRLAQALGTFLAADEALHYHLAHQPDLLEAYRAGLTNAHPPLFFLLLHLWIRLGDSETWLRLLPVLLGTAFLWPAWRWAEAILGKTAGLLTLFLLAFSPPLALLSAELRGYTLLLLLMAAALLALERAFETGSVRRMALFSALLYGAILTHYSAAWFTLAAGVYVLVRFLRGPRPPRLLATWAAFQAGAVLLYAFLWRVHISSLRGSEMERFARATWLKTHYFVGGEDGLLVFPVRQTAGLFAFLTGVPFGGWLGILLFLAGVVLLLRRCSPAALLLVLPFAFGLLGGFADVYPYGGTRHSVWLVLFASAAAAVPLAALARQKVLPAVLGAALVAPLWGLVARPPEQNMSKEDQREGWMTSALDTLRAVAPPGSVLFLDYQTSNILGYYLAREDFVAEQPAPESLLEFRWGGYRVLVSTTWNFDAGSFRRDLTRAEAVYRLPSGTDVVVANAGSGYNLALDLVRRFPGAAPPRLWMFGRKVSVFVVRIP